MAKLAAGFKDLIDRHKGDTVGFLVALQSDCEKIRNRIKHEIRRRLEIISVRELASRNLPRSWAIHFFSCPGDDIGPFAAWVAKLAPVDRLRISFYHNLEDAELARTFGPWNAADLGTFFEWRRATFHAISNQVVVDLNTPIVVDAGGTIDAAQGELESSLV